VPCLLCLRQTVQQRRHRVIRQMIQELAHRIDSLSTGGTAAHNHTVKQLGRPKKVLDTKRIATLRAKGVGWKRIAAQMGVGVGTIYRVAQDGSKTRERDF
jgi:DNA invertase Pin-like site-specific DNA recombinase